MISKRRKAIRISSRAFCMAAALGVCAFIAAPTARAITITQNTASVSTSTFIPGNSLTTPSGGPWDNITSIWFSNAPGTTPIAFGTPSNVSAATAEFLGQSQSIAAELYIFDPALQLQSSTRYFFYSIGSGSVSGNSDVAGENLYFTGSSIVAFQSKFADANYRLSGNAVVAVPEPSTFILFLTSVGLALGVSGWNTRL